MRPHLARGPRAWLKQNARSLKDGKQLRAIGGARARVQLAVSGQDARLVVLVPWRKRKAGLSNEREQLVPIRFTLCKAVSATNFMHVKMAKDIPPSARPPHENRMTVSPACRLLSKLMQPWVCRRDRVSQHGSLHQRFIQMVLPMR